jgi:hypothetical protein
MRVTESSPPSPSARENIARAPRWPSPPPPGLQFHPLQRLPPLMRWRARLTQLEMTNRRRWHITCWAALAGLEAVRLVPHS